MAENERNSHGRDVLWPLLAGLAAFGAALSGEFVFDDYAILTDPSITSPRGWLEVWSLLGTRPLTYFTFWLNYQLGGANPAGYHALNIALHLFAIWLLYDALRRVIPTQAARVAAVIFAVHPIQSEAVAYVFGRSSLLMTVFCLLSLRQWVRGRHWAAVAWFVPALLSKEECVAFPLFLFLMYLSVSRNAGELKHIGAMLALSVVAGVRVLFAAAVTPGSGAGSQAGHTPVEYLMTQGLAILRYLQLLFVPVGFTVESPIQAGFYWWAWAILAMIVLAVARWFGRAGPGFWVIAGLVLLLPSSSVFPAADLSADRRMYLPMAGFAAAAGIVLRKRPGIAMAALCVVLIPLSVDRTLTWNSGERLWREAMARAPHSVRPKLQLARLVDQREALSLLEIAKQSQSDNPSILTELGRVYIGAGQPEKALAEFGRALALLPNDAQALSNRAVALILLGQRDAARQDLERALQSDPCSFEARLNAKRLGLNAPGASHCRYSPDEAKALAE